MSVAVERATIGIGIQASVDARCCCGTYADVCIQHGIHVVLAFGIFHGLAEPVPVVNRVDDEGIVEILVLPAVYAPVVGALRAVAGGFAAKEVHGGVDDTLCCAVLIAVVKLGVGTLAAPSDEGAAVGVAAARALHLAVEQTVGEVVVGFVAVADEAAGIAFHTFHRGRDSHVADDVLPARVAVAAAHESCRVATALDGARNGKVFYGVVRGKLEGRFVVDGSIDVHGQRVAVAVEVATEGERTVAARLRGADVGIEAGIHIVLPLGILHFGAEGVPVGFAAYGDVVFLYILIVLQRRGARIDIHLDVVFQAGA